MVLAHDIKTVERTRDVRISVDVNFESMLLKKETLNGLETSGFYKPSPVQLHGIPLGKCGFDLFLEAKSGTGKTAVFSVIALEKLDLQKHLQSLILAPTREIAAQICDVIKQIGSMYNGLNVEVVMGGLPVGEDIEKLKKKVHILVGSPGRMRHLIQEKHIDISAVRLLVLDEADKLMDKSFQSDINYIFSALPKQKQVIMSSATYPETLKAVMKNYVHKVQHICPDNTAILLGINQFVTTVESHTNIVRQTQIKFKELLNILTKREFKQCLIFCNYQIRVVELCKMLVGAKWPAEQLHAQLEQSDRLDALKTLQEYKCRILVSTDLAARGIDASNVDLVINFEPPYEWQTYLHRMGRAGRFGAYGIVITILSVGKETVKFGDMIKSYSSSLNLLNLWDNNAFTLGTQPSLEPGDAPEELCSSPKETVVEQKILDEYDLTLKSRIKLKDKCDVESFGTLLNSFENSKEYKIESFSDLIASLESNKQEDDTEQKKNTTEGEDDLREIEEKPDTKKCINYEWDVKSLTMLSESLEKNNNCEIEPNTDIIASLNVPKSVKPNEENEIEGIISKNHQPSTMKDPNGQSKSNTSLKDSSNSDTDLENVNETYDNPTKNRTSKSHSPEDFGVPCIKSYLEAHIKENSSKAKIYKKQTLLDSAKKEKVTSDLYDCHKALLEAGLPTAFGSTKPSYNEYRPADRSNKHKFVKNKKLGNKCEESSTNKKIITKENQSTNIGSSESGYIDHPISYNGSTKYDRHSKKETVSEMANDICITSPNSYENYLAWYNQLKTHVKHVEMSLFMSELTNKKL